MRLFILRQNQFTVALVVLLVAISAFTALINPQQTKALSSSDFNAGYIISDSVFTNKTSMSTSQIQAFLNSKVPTCDTNGQQLSEYGGPDLNSDGKVQRWEWGKANYNQTVFTCLKDYQQGGRSSAQIIYDTSQEFNINPQVLIVLLQKEQALVTDTWPLDTPQYRSATGYGCPDTAACDTQYYGFTNQVRWAATMYKAIMTDSPTWYTPYELGNNSIPWHPNTGSCGYSTVNIENSATQALYNYTPYRPNQAALNAGYGSGDSCSSYGNRNFFAYFTDWFGSTTDPLISSSGLLLYGWNTGDPITAVFDVKNISKYTINVDYMRVRAFNGSGDQYLFWAKDNLVLKPGERYKYQQTIVIDREGDYTFLIDRKVGSTWYPVPFSDFNYVGQTSVNRSITHKPTLSNSLQFDKTSVHVNELVTASFGITNNSALRPFNIGTLKAEAFDSSGKQYQFNSTGDLTLAQGQTYNYSESIVFNRTGKYPFQIINYNPSLGWNSTYPPSDGSGITRQTTLDVKPQVTLTQGLGISPVDAREGDTLTASFKLKNFGTTSIKPGLLKVEAFDSSGKQYQFPSTDPNLTIAPGAEYTYSQTRTSPALGTYTFRIVNYNNSIGWNTALPSSEFSSIARQVKLTVKHPVEITSSLSITPASPTAGSPFSASFSVHNFGTTSINIGLLKVEAFDSSGNQYQFASTDPNLTIAPGADYTYSQSTTLAKTGTYTFRIVNKHPTFGWNFTLPSSQSANILRTQAVTVR